MPKSHQAHRSIPQEEAADVFTANTIKDLARILQEQPTWVETLPTLIPTKELLEIPERLDRFMQAQGETNQLADRHLNSRNRPART